jgi:hypothetical protein
MVTAGLIGYTVDAIQSLLVGDKSLKTVKQVLGHNTTNFDNSTS